MGQVVVCHLLVSPGLVLLQRIGRGGAGGGGWLAHTSHNRGNTRLGRGLDWNLMAVPGAEEQEPRDGPHNGLGRPSDHTDACQSWQQQEAAEGF